MSRTDRLSTYKTRVMATNGRVSVVYHSTLIVDATPDTVTLDHGGWMSVTTKRKMNQASRQFGLGFAVFQKAFDWFVTLPNGDTVEFERGMSFAR